MRRAATDGKSESGAEIAEKNARGCGAAAIILLFLYYAQGVVVTVLLSILLAYFLDPAVEFLERVRVPRTIGATAMVLVLLAVVGGAGYGLWSRAADFAASWPKYAET